MMDYLMRGLQGLWDAIGVACLICLLFIAAIIAKDWFFDQTAAAQIRVENRKRARAASKGEGET